MNREDSRRRAERAYRLRVVGRTWAEIADSEGFASRRSAQVAVARHLDRERPESVADARRMAADGLRITRSILFASLAHAKQAGDTQAVVAVARALTDNIDKQAKLLGLAVPQQVDITVSASASAILDKAEAELLALLPAQPHRAVLDVLDAEVITG
jgi:hypothetical protein